MNGEDLRIVKEYCDAADVSYCIGEETTRDIFDGYDIVLGFYIKILDKIFEHKDSALVYAQSVFLQRKLRTTPTRQRL